MKRLHLVFVSLILGISASVADTAKLESITRAQASLPLAQVSSVVVLGENKQSDKTYRLVVVDGGQSTDVSPRYYFYLTYFHASESNNSQTAFYLGTFDGLISAKKLEAGVYEITAWELSPETGERKKVKATYNVHQVALDEKKLSASWEEMSDPYFHSSITVSW